MFRQFHDILESWFYDLGVSNFLEQESRSFHNDKTVIPTTANLWKAFLKQILPVVYITPSSATNTSLSNLVEKLSNIGSYTTAKTMISLINESYLQFIPLDQQQNLETSLRFFQRDIPNWINGDQQEKIYHNPIKTIEEVKAATGIGDDWSCAIFLAELGFDFPHSQHAYQIWKNWSGFERENDGYKFWLQNLIELKGNLQSAKATDFIWNLVFSETKFLPIPKLCVSRFSCKVCPLEKDCKLRSTLIGSQHADQLQWKIQTGRSFEISTKDLIVYLLADRWKNSTKQHEIIENFPDLLFNESFPTCDESSEEELLIFLLGVRELAERFHKVPTLQEGKSFTSSEEIFNHFRFSLAKERQEAFYTLILNNRNQTIQLQMISKGTLNQSLVHPREVFAPALQLRAAAIVLIHNHPSGDPKPSAQDREVTKRLCEVGNLIGIKVIDHVIVSQNQYFSFIDENMMPQNSSDNSFLN